MHPLRTDSIRLAENRLKGITLLYLYCSSKGWAKFVFDSKAEVLVNIKYLYDL